MHWATVRNTSFRVFHMGHWISEVEHNYFCRLKEIQYEHQTIWVPMSYLMNLLSCRIVVLYSWLHKIIREKFKSGDYIVMLQNKLVQFMKLNYRDRFYSQENNFSGHKAKIVNQFMTMNHINVLQWPSKSLDLNILEDVWKLILEEAISNSLTYV